MIEQIAIHSYDDLDRRLIAQLRADGRAPVSKLATILGVSRSTVQALPDPASEGTCNPSRTNA